jgi:DNA-binding NarL/FixJ family response regulator
MDPRSCGAETDACRVFIADGDDNVRAALRLVLSREPGVAIVGETGDGKSLVELVYEARPHLILIDLSMPGLDETGLAERLHERVPAARLVFLSTRLEAAESAAVQASDVFISKAQQPDELLRIVRESVARCGHGPVEQA